MVRIINWANILLPSRPAKKYTHTCVCYSIAEGELLTLLLPFVWSSLKYYSLIIIGSKLYRPYILQRNNDHILFPLKNLFLKKKTRYRLQVTIIREKDNQKFTPLSKFFKILDRDTVLWLCGGSKRIHNISLYPWRWK